MPCAPAKATPTNTDTRKLVPFSEFTQEACLTSATRSPLRRSHQGKALFLEQSHYRRWGIKQPSGNADNVPFLTFDIHELASHSSLPSSEKRDTTEGLCTPTLFQSSGGAVAPSVSDRPPITQHTRTLCGSQRQPSGTGSLLEARGRRAALSSKRL